MGLNPYRKFVPRRADYVFVIAAVAAVVGLLMWAVLG
jgi:energy-coupling factor transporter transmembrane protein EcfT